MLTTARPTEIDKLTAAAHAVLPPARFEAEDDEHELLNLAAALRVTNAVTYTQAGECVIGLKRLLRRATNHYETWKKPINALRAFVGDWQTTDETIINGAITKLEPQILAYKQAREREDKLERERQQREADEKLRHEQAEAAAAMKRVADAEPDPQMKAALKQEARAIAQAPIAAARVAVVSTVPKVVGLSDTTRYSAEVVDLDLLILGAAKAIIERRFKGDCAKAFASFDGTGAQAGAVVANQSFINSCATRDKDTFAMPGVRLVKDTGLVGR